MEIYSSKRKFRSMWQKYRIYQDRVELSYIFGLVKIRIPLHEIVSIEIFPAFVFRISWWALKLDFADLFRHVGIRRKSGLLKKIRFTPDDPEQFVTIVKEMTTELGLPG
jgi:hypothetical protein